MTDYQMVADVWFQASAEHEEKMMDKADERREREREEN